MVSKFNNSVKRTKRPTSEAAALKSTGTMFVVGGGIICLISLPLVLILIGIFPLIGGLMMIISGVRILNSSTYNPIPCPKCHTKLNPFKDRVICTKCKNVMEVKL